MSNTIKWGHFSDLHFQYNETFQTAVLREKLLKKFDDDNIILDFIVITGDIGNKSVFCDDTLNFIDSLRTQTGCDKNNLFITCGNHDIDRNDDRSEYISKQREKKKLDINYSISDYSLKILFNVGHEKFINTYNKLTGENYGEYAHFIKERKNYNIYNINTCILSGENGEEGTLSVCDNHLLKLKKNNLSNQNKLNIAIGHHGIDCIDKSEQNQLISFFDDMNIDIYLCGHNHEIGFKNWDSSKNHISQFMCGGIFKDSYNSPSFIITEYDIDTYRYTTTIYSYSTNNLDWNVMSDARYPFKNGTLDFTPKRLKSKVSNESIKELAVSYNTTQKIAKTANTEYISNIDNTYSDILSLQSLKLNNVMTKIDNKNNLFQNNSAYIYSTIEGIEEKHIILCDRIYNKFYENSQYSYLKHFELLFTPNSSSLKTQDDNMHSNIVNTWYNLINELLKDSSIQIINVNISASITPLDIIIKRVIQNYDTLFAISSKFILGDTISDSNILSHLNLTKKIILEENNYFFGFEAQIKSLLDIVSSKQSGYYCIRADEGYGKTSLLSRLIGYMMENKSNSNSNKIANLLPWLPNAIVVFGKQATDINIAVKMIVEQANLLLVNPILYENTTTQNFHSILYTTFESLSKELGGIVIVLDAVDEFKANSLNFLPEILPDGITVFISARKFTRDYNDRKRNLTNIRHNGFTNEDDKAILDFYGLPINEKDTNKFIKDVLNKTSGWPLIVCDIKKQLEKVNNDFKKVQIESSLNSVFYRKKNMWKENGSTNCCRWHLLELFSIFASACYLSKNNIQSYLLTYSNYSCINSEEIEGILDCVSDQFISDDGGLYKLKYASFSEYITDNKTGFTTIELRIIITNIVSWLGNNLDDNIEIIVPFYIAWRDNIDIKIKNSIEGIIDLLVDKNKYTLLTQIASLLMSKNTIDSTIENCLNFALNKDEKAKLLYANYLYDIVETDISRRRAIDFYKDLSEKGNIKALLIYTDMLITGTKYVELDEAKALKLLDQFDNDIPNEVAGMKYNIISNVNSKFYDIDKSINIIYNLANKNDLGGMTILGSRLLRGSGIEKDPIEGEKWFRKAADGGFRKAMAILGSKLIDGDVITQDIIEGEKWLKKAADAGYNEAMGELGSRLIDGRNISQDIIEGEKWLKKAADNGYMQAMFELSFRFTNGQVLIQDPVEGEKWLRKAADSGYTTAMIRLGLDLIDGDGITQDIIEGEQWLRKAADDGHMEAMAILGSRLIDGDVITQDIIEGEKWLKKSADNGYMQAMGELGSRLIDGRNINQDIIEGEKWLKKAADNGYMQAMFELSFRFTNGEVLIQDPVEGEKWLRKAADSGYTTAMIRLGLDLIDGDGITQDIIEGEQWLRKAADDGNTEAMAILGSKLIDGNGSDQNISEGIKLCLESLNNGHSNSANILGLYYYKMNDIKQSVFFFEKGVLLGDDQSKNNISYIIRNGEYPNYSGTPNIYDLLKNSINNKDTFALINYSLYLISNLNTAVDWIKADYYISLIDNNSDTVNYAISWWQSLSNNGNLEGDLVLGWLCLRVNINDPDGLSAKERFAKSMQFYNIPNWLMEQITK